MKLLSLFLLVSTIFVHSADKNSPIKHTITIPPLLPLSELLSNAELAEVTGMVVKPFKNKTHTAKSHSKKQSTQTSSNSSYQTFDEIDGNKKRKKRSEIIGCCSCFK